MYKIFIPIRYSTLQLGTKDKSVSEHLSNLSTLAHILFVVYRKSRTSFMPAQTYENIITFIVAHYKSVAQMKVENITAPFYIFQNSDDRLENLFGILRSLVRGMRGFDGVQFEERATGAMQVAGVFADKPHWEAPSRERGAGDNVNPKSWTGDTSVEHVDLKECWEDGERRAGDIFKESGLFDDRAYNFKKISAKSAYQYITVLKPRGQRVGVFAGEGAAAGSGSDDEHTAMSDDECDGEYKGKEASEDDMKLAGRIFVCPDNGRTYKVVQVTYSRESDAIVAYRKVPIVMSPCIRHLLHSRHSLLCCML